jgi:hypothetical protein
MQSCAVLELRRHAGHSRSTLVAWATRAGWSRMVVLGLPQSFSRRVSRMYVADAIRSHNSRP